MMQRDEVTLLACNSATQHTYPHHITHHIRIHHTWCNTMHYSQHIIHIHAYRIVSYNISYASHHNICTATHHNKHTAHARPQPRPLPSRRRDTAHQRTSPARSTHAEHTPRCPNIPRKFHCTAQESQTVSIRSLRIGGPGETQTISLFLPAARK